MAKPISPSYPVTGKQARELAQEIERTDRGDVNPDHLRMLEENAKKALHFFRNASSILSSRN